jgi:phenylpyruvate tautomerase PptA (4-oxalocrotonate tautomerase family)
MIMLDSREVAMPIVDIEIVVRAGETVGRERAAEIAERAGEIFGSQKGGTWVKIRTIPWEYYAESGANADDEVLPVFVSILKAHLPKADSMKAEVSSLTEAIAKICAREPENVHLIYEPGAAGRVAFGGTVVEG